MRLIVIEFDGSEVVGLYSPSTSSSLMRDSKLPSTTYPVFTTASTLNKKQSAPFRRYRKGQHVVVRPSNEAFYYPGKEEDELVSMTSYLVLHLRSDSGLP